MGQEKITLPFLVNDNINENKRIDTIVEKQLEILRGLISKKYMLLELISPKARLECVDCGNKAEYINDYDNYQYCSDCWQELLEMKGE